MQLILFQLFLLPIIIVTYRLPPRQAARLVAVISLFTVILATVKGEWSYLVNLPIFYLVNFLTHKFPKEEIRLKEKIKETLDQAQAHNQEISALKKVVEEKNQKTEAVIEDLSGLYQVTKDLNETLDLKKTIEIIIPSLNETFSYGQGWILLVDKHKIITTAIDLKVGLDKPADLEQIKNDPLLRQALTNLFPVTLNEEEIKKIVTPAELKTFTSVPLVAANELLGLLVLTDLEPKYVPEEDSLSRLCILSSQYALEINKARLYEKLQALAITDGLTKVYRRHHFLERYQEEILRTKRYTLDLSLLMLDIDHFKNFNEQYGHLYGDAVLGEVARLLKQGVREMDLVCRYGGEEFLVMLPETNKSQAELVAERLRQNISANKFQAYGETTTITISLGLASLPEDKAEGQALIDAADEALLRAKKEGRNRVCLY